MNLYKSKIIKSESVRIVDQNGDSPSGGAASDAQAAARSARAAQEQVQDAIREAFEKGVSEGMKKGRDLERRASASAMKAVAEAVHKTGQLRASIVERSEEDILDLVFAIAEKVIHHEVTVNRGIVAGVLKSAVQAINDREHIRVRCHPGDFAVLKELRPELAGMMDGIDDMDFVEDQTIMAGGVKIETASGEVDARLDRQFEVIRNALLS